MNDGIRTMALMEFKIDGANTTDGGIDTHGDDLSDEIDGTYENDRKGVFFLIDVMEFQK